MVRGLNALPAYRTVRYYFGMSENATDWIKPGAEVVVYRDVPGGTPDPRIATVARVAKQSFTVDGVDERIQFDRLESKRLGSTWSGYRYRVVRPGTEQARELFEIKQRARLRNYASAAVRRWQEDPTKEHRLHAIEALQKVED